jgi:hypothetical protein
VIVTDGKIAFDVGIETRPPGFVEVTTVVAVELFAVVRVITLVNILMVEELITPSEALESFAGAASVDDLEKVLQRAYESVAEKVFVIVPSMPMKVFTSKPVITPQSVV